MEFYLEKKIPTLKGKIDWGSHGRLCVGCKSGNMHVMDMKESAKSEKHTWKSFYSNVKFKTEKVSWNPSTLDKFVVYGSGRLSIYDNMASYNMCKSRILHSKFSKYRDRMEIVGRDAFSISKEGKICAISNEGLILLTDSNAKLWSKKFPQNLRIVEWSRIDTSSIFCATEFLETINNDLLKISSKNGEILRTTTRNDKIEFIRSFPCNLRIPFTHLIYSSGGVMELFIEENNEESLPESIVLNTKVLCRNDAKTGYGNVQISNSGRYIAVAGIKISSLTQECIIKFYNLEGVVISKNYLENWNPDVVCCKTIKFSRTYSSSEVIMDISFSPCETRIAFSLDNAVFFGRINPIVHFCLFENTLVFLHPTTIYRKKIDRIHFFDLSTLRYLGKIEEVENFRLMRSNQHLMFVMSDRKKKITEKDIFLNDNVESSQLKDELETILTFYNADSSKRFDIDIGYKFTHFRMESEICGKDAVIVCSRFIVFVILLSIDSKNEHPTKKIGNDEMKVFHIDKDKKRTDEIVSLATRYPLFVIGRKSGKVHIYHLGISYAINPDDHIQLKSIVSFSRFRRTKKYVIKFNHRGFLSSDGIKAKYKGVIGFIPKKEGSLTTYNLVFDEESRLMSVTRGIKIVKSQYWDFLWNRDEDEDEDEDDTCSSRRFCVMGVKGLGFSEMSDGSGGGNTVNAEYKLKEMVGECANSRVLSYKNGNVVNVVRFLDLFNVEWMYNPLVIKKRTVFLRRSNSGEMISSGKSNQTSTSVNIFYVSARKEVVLLDIDLKERLSYILKSFVLKKKEEEEEEEEEKDVFYFKIVLLGGRTLNVLKLLL